jgi:hypothetical protein
MMPRFLHWMSVVIVYRESRCRDGSTPIRNSLVVSRHLSGSAYPPNSQVCAIQVMIRRYAHFRWYWLHSIAGCRKLYIIGAHSSNAIHKSLAGASHDIHTLVVGKNAKYVVIYS